MTMLEPTAPNDSLNWSTYEPRYQDLISRNLAPGAVPAWLSSWSDLEKDVRETYATLMRTKDENTADRAAEESYLRFIREVMPKFKIAVQELRTKLFEVKAYQPQPEHTQMVRRLRNEADLFREENVPLQTELEALCNEFNKLMGALTAEVDGETLTLPQAERRLLEPDRALRERAWWAVEAAKAEVVPALDNLFLKLLPLRRQIAKNAGLPDYRAYRWRTFGRFDYTPEDNLRLIDAIEKEVVPLVAERREARRRTLEVGRLRPWDLAVDPQSLPPLKPFSTTDELEEGLVHIFSRLDPELGAQFAAMRGGWLDLEPRKGKVPGLGYQMTFPRSNKTYIYHSAVGTHTDVWVLLHEAGHAFHALAASAQHDLLWNRYPGMEFAEVASQAMELLALPYLEKDEGGFYTAEEAARAREEQLDRVLRLLTNTARGEAFQHWLYAEAPENVTVQELGETWTALCGRFDTVVDWSGLEQERAKGWQQGVIFQVPFYMLDYAMAYLGALQVWRNSLEDKEKALKKYREALALGGSRPLPELFETVGARFAFDQEVVRELMQFVRVRI